MRLLIVVFLAALSQLCLGQKGNKDCSLMKNGRFKYLEGPDPSAYFVITDTSHTEFHAGGKYHIISQMNWLSPCKYQLKMIENTVPGFEFKPGDVMVVTITRTRDGIVSYTCKVNGQKWSSKVKKIE